MTDPHPNDDTAERWFRAVLVGRRLPPPEEPEPDKPAVSFHGGPRLTAWAEPDPSTLMDLEIRRAMLGLPPDRRREPGSGHRR